MVLYKHMSSGGMKPIADSVATIGGGLDFIILWLQVSMLEYDYIATFTEERVQFHVKLGDNTVAVFTMGV